MLGSVCSVGSTKVRQLYTSRSGTPTVRTSLAFLRLQRNTQYIDEETERRFVLTFFGAGRYWKVQLYISLREATSLCCLTFPLRN